MGRNLLLILLFSIIVALVAGYYGLVPIPWLEEGALNTRDTFVNKSTDVLDSSSD